MRCGSAPARVAARQVGRTLALIGLLALSLAGAAPAQADEPGRVDQAPIELSTPSGTLRGSLTIPATLPPWPVALIHAGSGPTDRDGNSLAAGLHADALRALAAGLATHGIASVRYDKRGIGASAMVDETTLRIDTYVADASAWIALLRADRRFSSVTFIGHSEGALIGALAIKSQAVDALVWISAPAAPAADILREQLKGKLPPELEAENARILSSLEAGRRVDDVPAALASLYRPSAQGYVISWFRFDPSRELANAAAPVLVVQGTSDLQVATRNADLLKAARPDARIVTIAGMNHMLKQTGDDLQRQQQSVGDPAMPLAPGLVDAIAKFISEAPKLHAVPVLR